MPITITMPRLSDTMETGTVIKWNVKEGDQVSSGDVIADIETDKATMELSAYDDGVVTKLSVPEGKPVSVGTVIAEMSGEGESAPSAASTAKRPPAASQTKSQSAAKPAEKKSTEPAADSEGAEVEPAPQKPARPAAKTDSPRQTKPAAVIDKDIIDAETSDHEDQPAPHGRTRISPVARHLAEEHEIDLRSIEGSGPGGRIIKRDVLKAIDGAAENVAAVPPSAAGDQRSAISVQRNRTEEIVATRVTAPEPELPMGAPGAMRDRSIQLSGMRQTIARRLVESKTTIPHYQVTATFNMDPLLAMRTQLNEQLQSQGVKLSVNDFLVRACGLAMYRHPLFNASWAGDHIDVHGDINIGIAISLPAERGGGLVVATLRNADQKSLRVISFESKNLAEKARTRGLSIDEMSDTTFTISNLGMFGVDNFTAIINPPNSAILAVGAAIEKPVVRDHQLTIGHEMSGTLSCDHRVIDGATAAQYLQTLRELIEIPAGLIV